MTNQQLNEVMEDSYLEKLNKLISTYSTDDQTVIRELFGLIVNGSDINQSDDLRTIYDAMKWFVEARRMKDIDEILFSRVTEKTKQEILRQGVEDSDPESYLQDFWNLLVDARMSATFDENGVHLFDNDSERQTTNSISLKCAVGVLKAKVEYENLVSNWI